MRMVLEHRNEYQSESAAIRSIGEKLGVHDESIRIWVRRAQVDAGERAGLTTEERERLRLLEREVRELRRANESSRAPHFSSRRSSTVDDRCDPYDESIGQLQPEPAAGIVSLVVGAIFWPDDHGEGANRAHERPAEVVRIV